MAKKTKAKRQVEETEELDIEERIRELPKKKKKKKIPVKIDAPAGSTVFQLPSASGRDNFNGVIAGIKWESGQTFVKDPEEAAKKYRNLKRYYGVKMIRRGAPKIVEPEISTLVEEDEE